MKKYKCSVCGYIHLKEGAPENCPSCGAPKEQFKEKDDAIKLPKDPDNKTDLEKKHIPLILINKKCGLIEGCVDVHVKMGEIIHPMQEDHSITAIDFYLDEKFISRTQLTPENMQPAGCLHLSADSGKLTVVDHCNLHGSWIAEKTL